MAEYIRFRSIVYDTMTLASMAKSHNLFMDERLVNCNPVNLKGEQEIVQWLFSNENFVRLLIVELGQEKIQRPFLEVPRQEFQGSPEKLGDFDVLFCPYGRFDEVTCIEFKRVKLEQYDYGGKSKINGLQSIGKLTHQGNVARRTGFHKTYIAAVALINTSGFVRPNIMTKFEPTAEYKALYHIHNFGQLDAEVGALLIEVEQPTGKDYQKNGQINVARLKHPMSQDQSSKVTEDFKRISFRREIGVDKDFH
jgi:hypothetical protein